MSKRRLLLYRALLFRSSCSNRRAPFVFFFITFRYDVAAWSEITHVERVEAQMIHFELFLSARWYAGAISTPRPKQYNFFRLGSWRRKNFYLFRGWRTEVKMDQPEFSITNNLYCPGIGKEIYLDFSSLRKQNCFLSFNLPWMAWPQTIHDTADHKRFWKLGNSFYISFSLFLFFFCFCKSP